MYSRMTADMKPTPASQDETAHDKQDNLICRGDLEDAADTEHNAANDDGRAAADEVADVPGNQGSEEGATGKNGGHERLGRRRQAELGRTDANGFAGCIVEGYASVLGDEEGHAEHA
jgi:hypothetical protein